MHTETRSSSKKHKRLITASYLHPAFLIPYCLSVILGLCWPLGGISLEPLNSTMDWIVRNVPSICAYVEKSQFPEVSKAYFTLTFFVFLPTLWLFLTEKDLLMGRLLGFEGQWLVIQNDKIPAVRVIFALLFLSILLFFLFIQPGYQFGLMPLNNSRSSLAFLGGVVSWLAAFAFLGLLKNYLHYFIRLIKGG